MKKRKFSAYDDFKTGFLYKICITVGLLFLFTYIILKLLSIIYLNYKIEFLRYLYDLSSSNFSGIIISFSILLISAGLIIYFFKRQFNKLAEIANEIEQNNN